MEAGDWWNVSLVRTIDRSVERTEQFKERSLMVKALWNTFFSKRRAGPSIRPVLTGHFLTFQSFCFGLIYNIWNSLNVKPQYPSSNKNQKRDTKKTLQFLSTDTPCHHLLFQNDLTMKEWSSGSHSTGHHMLITNLSLQLCRIRKHWKWNHIKYLHMQMSLPLGGVFLGKKKKIRPLTKFCCRI